MLYPSNIEDKLGFSQIRKLISSRCVSVMGKENSFHTEFSTTIEHIRKDLQLTHEFMRIVREEDSFPGTHFVDLRQSLNRIRIDGTFLDVDELIDLKKMMEAVRDIKRFLERENSPYEALIEHGKEVVAHAKLIQRIDAIIHRNGKVKDNASPELASIRRELAKVNGSISKTLNGILRSAQMEGLVDKDASPALRDGRLVIPIAPAHKRKIRGIVHDESATGKTIYIEPAEVVEANNRIRELESEERKEIIKILTAVTSEIRAHIDELHYSLQYLGEIDFIRAKAVFSIDIEATIPHVVDSPTIDWANAVHPLLMLSLRKQNKKVEPLTIELNEKNRILVISGPNAGGKSVCLKTVGLLQMMLQHGMPVPMHESSKMGLFGRIFIDIGDEQSLEDDLSTYSSHLTNMKYFDKNCNHSTLLLIDEFGTGTEPQIGGAIAESLLNSFNKKKSYGVITTHYQNLKHFAEETEGVVNGAMLYDRHIMQPLFKLSIGNPGSSFAIEIARKIGLPEEVINNASEIVGQDYVNMDKYLQDIVRDKRYWESKRDNIRKQEKRVSELESEYKTALAELSKERKQLSRDAKSDALRLLNEANAKIENTIRQIKEKQAEKESTRLLRQELVQFKQQLLNEPTDEEIRINRKIEKLQSKKKRQKKPSTAIDPIQVIKPFEVGQYVRLSGQTTVGKVLDLNGDNAVVAFGQLKSTVKTDRLEHVHNHQPKKEAKTTFVSEQTADLMYEKKLNFRQDIDIRGMRADEALQAITYFVDDAIQVGIEQVRILHGTGTGALRELTRNYLGQVRGVRSFRDEHVQFGGTGITIVEFE